MNAHSTTQTAPNITAPLGGEESLVDTGCSRVIIGPLLELGRRVAIRWSAPEPPKVAISAHPRVRTYH